jgi:MerR family copper efflux transcriptional regulator
MTIGSLSRRTGVTVKTLRTYEDLGLIATVGRSPGNYRLFGEEALWCVAVVEELRGLGLTLAEITEFAEPYLHADAPLGPRVAAVLAAARTRTRARIDTLQARLERLDRFEDEHVEELAGRADFRADDPCFRRGT